MDLDDRTPPDIAAARRAAARIYRAWDAALGAKDLDASIVLYAENATLESPLIRHLLGIEAGVIQGHEALCRFVEIVFHRTPQLRRRYRRGFFTDGTMLMWEYPRCTPEDEQMDLVEVMELRDGLIQHHRVYWGRFGVKMLQEDRYRAG